MSLLLLGCLALVGCSSGGTVPVGGRVLLNGNGLAHARIGFSPLQSGAAGFGNTTSDANGNFTLAEGLPPGEYMAVVVLDPTAVPGLAAVDLKATPEQQRQAHEAAEKLRRSIPNIYTRPETTPLRVTLPARQALKLELTDTPGP